VIRIIHNPTRGAFGKAAATRFDEVGYEQMHQLRE
jgi:hypothetical protein